MAIVSGAVRWCAAVRIRSRQHLSPALLDEEAERVDLIIASCAFGGKVHWREAIRVRSHPSSAPALLDEHGERVDLVLNSGGSRLIADKTGALTISYSRDAFYFASLFRRFY